MSERGKRKGTIHISGHSRPNSPQPEAEGASAARSRRDLRSREELAPIAQRVAQNAELVEQFLRARGSDNVALGNELIEDIARFAQSIEPTITQADAARITVLLMEMFALPGDKSNG